MFSGVWVYVEGGPRVWRGTVVNANVNGAPSRTGRRRTLKEMHRGARLEQPSPGLSSITSKNPIKVAGFCPLGIRLPTNFHLMGKKASRQQGLSGGLSFCGIEALLRLNLIF